MKVTNSAPAPVQRPSMRRRSTRRRTGARLGRRRVGREDRGQCGDDRAGPADRAGSARTRCAGSDEGRFRTLCDGIASCQTSWDSWHRARRAWPCSVRTDTGSANASQCPTIPLRPLDPACLPGVAVAATVLVGAPVAQALPHPSIANLSCGEDAVDSTTGFADCTAATPAGVAPYTWSWTLNSVPIKAVNPGDEYY